MIGKANHPAEHPDQIRHTITHTKEDKTMMNKINDEALKNVTGGTKRTVDTGTSQNAAVRSGAGKGFEQIASLENGTTVNATGKFKEADGRSWAQIDSPVNGWIAASIIGYDR
jgi:type IV secretory pathway TrbL component